MRKTLPGFKPLKGLLLAICLSILAALPAAAAVLKPSLTLPPNTILDFNYLTDYGIVDMDFMDYAFCTVSISDESYATTGMVGTSDGIPYNPYIVTTEKAGSFNVKFTNNEHSDKSFTLYITTKPWPTLDCDELFVGVPVTFNFGSDVFPLGLTTVKKGLEEQGFTGDFTYKIDASTNSITITATKAGRTSFTFWYNGMGSGGPCPLIYDFPKVTIKENNLSFPVGGSISIHELIDEGIISVAGDDDYMTKAFETSSENDEIECWGSGITWSTVGNFTVLFTHKYCPGAEFTLDLASYNHPDKFITTNLKSLYEDEVVTLTMPVDVMPLSEYESITVEPRDENNTEEIFSIDVDYQKNQIVVTGIHEGQANLCFKYNKHGFNDTQKVYNIVVEHSDRINITKPEIILPTDSYVTLSTLAESGIIEGMTSSYNYIPSSEDPNVECSEYGFTAKKSGKYTITCNHRTRENFSFDLNITVLDDQAASFIEENLGTLSDKDSKTITLPVEIFPLSEYKSIKIESPYGSDVDPESIVGIEIDYTNNSITFKGKSEGWVSLSFEHKYTTRSYSTGIRVIHIPSADDITIAEPNIKVPVWGYVNLKSLIDAGVVKGVPESDVYNYSPSCNNSNVDCQTYAFRPKEAGTYTITFTHREYPDVTFDIEVTVLKGIEIDVNNIYEGNSYTLDLPNDAMPLSEYKDFYLEAEEGVDPNTILKFEVNYDSNQIVFTGLKEGVVRFVYESEYGSSSAWINVIQKPSADNINVREPSIVFPTETWVELRTLINAGVVEGAIGNNADYTMEYEKSNCITQNTNGNFYFNSPITTTVTFKNKEFPDVEFSIEFIAKYSPAEYVYRNLGTVYVGETNTLTFPDSEDYMPLSDFKISKGTYSDYPNADFSFTIEGKTLSVTGITEGRAYLGFENRFGFSSGPITIANKPTADNIKVIEPSIMIPTNRMINLWQLTDNGIVEGATGSSSDYYIKASNGIAFCDTAACSFRLSRPGTDVITYTNKQFPEVKFSIEVTAKYGANFYINSNLGNIYVGESKTLTIPDEYLPLSYYTLEKGNYSNYPDTEFDFNVDGNKITFTGVTEGVAYLLLQSRFGKDDSEIVVETKKAPVEVNEEGEATAGSQIGVPVTVDLPKDIDLSVNEGEKIEWQSENTDIAEVDPVTGTITPKGLGVTYINVKKITDGQSVSLLSRDGSGDNTLVTIEFWVTELVLDQDIELFEGYKRQLTYTVNAGDKTYPYDVKAEWSSSNSDVATVNNNGLVTAKKSGSTVITLTTNIGTCEVIVNVEASGKDPFDINIDGKVNVSDVVSLVDKIIHKTADPAVHDLNGDTFVNVSDIVLLVNQILHGEAAKSVGSRSADATEVPMLFDMSRACTAMQTDIIVAEEARIEDVAINSAIARSHSLSYREIEPGRYRVIVFSAANQPMQLDEDEPLFTLAVTGDSRVETEATVFVDTELVPTAIDAVGSDAEVESVMYFDLQGRQVSTETKGIVIERTVFTNGRVSTRKIKK